MLAVVVHRGHPFFYFFRSEVEKPPRLSGFSVLSGSQLNDTAKDEWYLNFLLQRKVPSTGYGIQMRISLSNARLALGLRSTQ